MIESKFWWPAHLAKENVSETSSSMAETAHLTTLTVYAVRRRRNGGNPGGGGRCQAEEDGVGGRLLRDA